MSLRKKLPQELEKIELTFFKEALQSETSDDKSENPIKLANSHSTSEISLDESVSSTTTQWSSFNSLEVNFDQDSILTELSKDSSIELDCLEDVYCRRRNSSRFRMNKCNRTEPTILNNFLDFLSTCFWKCSSGCQQLPEKQY